MACSIRRTLTRLVKRSPSRLSQSVLARPEDVAGDGEREFERNQLPDARQIAASARNPAHHGIDDELGDPEHRQRQKRAEQAENAGCQHQRRTGIPNHADQGPDVAQRRQPVAPGHVLGRTNGLGWVHRTSITSCVCYQIEMLTPKGEHFIPCSTRVMFDGRISLDGIATVKTL